MLSHGLTLASVILAIVMPAMGQNITFDPEILNKVPEKTSHTVRWFVDTKLDIRYVTAQVEDTLVAEVTGVGEVELGGENDNYTHSGVVNVTATFIGYNKINVTLYNEANETITSGKMDMSVLLENQTLNDIFTLIMAALVAILYLVMGATLDLEIIKGILKKPIGPAVGVFCQYVLMPAISYFLGLVLFPDDALLRLGLFLNGSCPGGGASNMWTHLLGGSLDLSIMMTFISTITAFGAVPFWVLVMGPVIVAEEEFIIPFMDILITVVSLIIPCGVGILIQIKFPKTVKYFEKILTPLSAFNLIFIFTFGIYAYLYVFTIFTWRMLVSGIALPSLGYVAGMLMALMFRMPAPKVIAISVETGVQNYTIALLILQFTLESPAGELSAAVPAAATLFTPAPLLTMLVIKKLYDRYKRGSSLDIPPTPKDTKAATNNTKPQVTDGSLPAKSATGHDNPAMEMQDEAV